VNSFDQSILSLVAALAPDRMASVTADAHLVDDLGYDSPRKMELAATLENHLQVRLKDPDIPVETVHDVIGWVNANVSENA
jgi:acyl carrier protein